MPKLDRNALKEAKERLTEWLRVCDEEAFYDYDELSNDDIKTVLASLEEAEGRIEAAREAFLNFVAGAKKFEQDIDGEYEDGRSVVTIRYDITTEHHGLWELIGALGFKHRRDETPFDAVCREIDEEPVAALSEEEA